MSRCPLTLSGSYNSACIEMAMSNRETMVWGVEQYSLYLGNVQVATRSALDLTNGGTCTPDDPIERRCKERCGDTAIDVSGCGGVSLSDQKISAFAVISSGSVERALQRLCVSAA